MSLVSLIEEGLTRMASHMSPAIAYPQARKSLQLEQFRCTDFRSMQAELIAVFPNSHEGLRLQCLPFARNVAADLAAQYILSPLREWLDADPAVVAVLERIYATLDSFLLEAEQAGSLSQGYLIGVFPGELDPEPMLFLPHQVVRIQFDSPLAAASGDVSRAAYVELLVPTPAPDEVRSEWALGHLWYSKLVLTREMAFFEYPDGSREGVFAPDGSHPLGRVPLVSTRRVKPAETHSWLPPIAEDVRACQIGVNLAVSDIDNTVRECSVPSMWASGDNAKSLAKNINNKVGKIGILPPEVVLQQFALVPQVQPYIQALETTIYYVQSWRKTRPEAFQGSIVTGAARRADAEGFVEERRKQETRTRVLELGLLRLLVDVANTMPRAMRLEAPDLRVTYRYVRSEENALQEAQSLAVLTGLGLRDVVVEVAKTEGISPQKAEQLIVDRLKRKRDLFGAVAQDSAEGTPGLDKLDKSVPAPGGPPDV